MARADFADAFQKIDTFLENAGTPERKEAIDASLNVVRAVAKVEEDALGNIAARIPEGEGIMVGVATVEWVVSSMQVLLQWTARELAEPSGVATADFLDLMVQATEDHLDSLMGRDPREVAAEDIRTLRVDLRTHASAGAARIGLSRVPEAAQRLATHKPQGDDARRLAAINETLLERLKSVETTASSRAAMQHVLGDMRATLRTVVNLVHLFGAASNDLMDEDERVHAIQGSIERMGPLFVKLMQTLANMQSLLAKISPDDNKTEEPDAPAAEGAEKNDALFTGLKRLQDEVTPLPWPYIEDQIRSSLELSADAPLVEADGTRAPFVSIDTEPLKSGSIGQTHRAKIRVDREGGEEIVDVVVKVLRPDIDKTFEDTIRITRLTILIFKELLRLDANGAIFREVKDQAERIISMLERALEGFIETFRVETDFVQEAENIRRFRVTLAPDRNIVVPEVFDSHSRGNILTMEEIKGFKLTRWLERHRFAEASETLAEQRGALPAQHRGAEALRRAEAWIEQTYRGTPIESSLEVRGRLASTVRVRFVDSASRVVERCLEVRSKDGRIRPSDGAPIPRSGAVNKSEVWGRRAFGLPVRASTVERVDTSRPLFGEGDGYLIHLDFESPHAESATVFVDRKTGDLEPRTKVPDLTLRGMEGLRDRLATTFGVQLARGLLHGDPHEGNFFVLPDGKTVGLVDFGLAIELGMFDAGGPLKLLSGAFLGRPEAMAEAILSMSTQADLPPGEERDTILESLTAEYERILEVADAETKAKKRDLAKKPFFQRLKATGLLRFSRTIEVSRRALEHILRTGALAPSPKSLQALKATFSMGGNLAEIEKTGVKTPLWRRAARFFKEITLQTALRPFIRRPRPAPGSPAVELPRLGPSRPWVRDRLEDVRQPNAP